MTSKEKNGVTSVSIQEDYLLFPCNQTQAPQKRRLDPNIASILQSTFGDKALEALKRHLETVPDD